MAASCSARAPRRRSIPRRSRAASDPTRAWPRGDAVEPPAPPPAELAAALDALFANSPGIYGILIASPDRVLAERYSAFGAPDRATPSWSMTKAVTCTLIGRLIHEGWLGSVYDPAPAPLWRDPRSIHHLITLDHLLRMRSGLGFPVVDEHGHATIGFENSAVYQDAADAFDAAQRSIVATVPGSVYRYINAGINVLGAIIRDRIESRGLPYHATLYGLLADRLGMGTYQHSADCTGNFIASGSGFATLRDYAKLGVLYVQDGVWDGERLLPPGWADYALTPTHAGSSYAACFRSNADRSFPDLPPDTAWASGASDQRIFILRRHRLVVSVANETDHPMDLAALNRVIATAIWPHAGDKRNRPCPPSATSPAKSWNRAQLSLGCGVRLTRSVEIAIAMKTAGLRLAVPRPRARHHVDRRRRADRDRRARCRHRAARARAERRILDRDARCSTTARSASSCRMSIPRTKRARWCRS